MSRTDLISNGAIVINNAWFLQHVLLLKFAGTTTVSPHVRHCSTMLRACPSLTSVFARPILSVMLAAATVCLSTTATSAPTRTR